MASQSPLLHQCLNAAVAASGALLQRCLEQAIASLQDAENKSGKVSERHELADAWRQMQTNRAVWVERYPRDLRLVFNAGAVPTRERVVPRRATPNSLVLVDDASVIHSIESKRLFQLLLPCVEQSLAELDGLMSSALGLAAVRPELNPVRPEVFSQTLRTLMGAAAAPPASSALWMRHLAVPLGHELNRLYLDLSRRLSSANVDVAPYRVLAAPQPRAAASHGGGQRPAGAAEIQQLATAVRSAAATHTPSGWADLASDELGGPLLQEFLYRGSNRALTVLAPAYYVRVGEQLGALEATPDQGNLEFDPRQAAQYQHLPAVDRPSRSVGTGSPLNGARWGAYGAARHRSLVRTRLKQQAKHVGQALGLEVVRKLVNQVAQDPRLLAPVREAIVALEPSLLRLAMVDPRFFSQEQNPARRLVERVADRSFKYNDEFSVEFKVFFDPVAESFNALNEQEIASEAPFKTALTGLEKAWTTQDRQEAAAHEGVLDAVRFAEQRQIEADRIAWGLSQRSDLENVPAPVQDFLFGSWALVMAHARLTDTRKQIDPGAHGSIVSNLIWSVKPEVTLRQPVKLIEMIPGLLLSLRSGLAELGQDVRESNDFFQALEKLHRPVLQLRAMKRRDAMDSAQADLESSYAGLESGYFQLDDDSDGLPEASVRVPEPAGTQLWMGRRELEAAGFEDTMPSDFPDSTGLRESNSAVAQGDSGDAELSAAVEGVGEDEGMSDVDVEAILASLYEDCWVDLYSKKRWLRARLMWASTKGTLFMFVSHGGRPHSMTRRSCERLIRERLLRLVQTHGAVSQAIGSMAAETLQATTAPQPLSA